MGTVDTVFDMFQKKDFRADKEKERGDQPI
jgi:hypothetical protein